MKGRKIEAVVTDLDGTLLNSEHKISEYNKFILNKLKEKGIKIILATGRLYNSLYKYKKELDLDTPVICYNGAVIVDGKNDKIIYNVFLEKEIVKEVVNIARIYNVHLNIFNGENWYIEKVRDEVEIYKNSSGLEYKLLDSVSFENITANKIMFVGENSKLKEIEKIIENKFDDNVYKAFSKPYFLEILNKNVSKGKALKYILETLNINPENVIAFGDAENDLEMLTNVGIGVAMGNGFEILKQKVNYLTDTNDNDGVGRFLSSYFDI